MGIFEILKIFGGVKKIFGGTERKTHEK